MPSKLTAPVKYLQSTLHGMTIAYHCATYGNMPLSRERWMSMRSDSPHRPRNASEESLTPKTYPSSSVQDELSGDCPCVDKASVGFVRLYPST